METTEDWYNIELMTQHAFWNKHHLGCDEHYLVHKLRQDKDYLPELSRIAVKDGEVIGCIMYSQAKVVDGADTGEPDYYPRIGFKTCDNSQKKKWKKIIKNSHNYKN